NDALKRHQSVAQLLPNKFEYDFSTIVKRFASKSAFIYNWYALLRKKSYSDLQDRNLLAIKQLINSGRIPGFILIVASESRMGWDVLTVKSVHWFQQNHLNFEVCYLRPEDFHRIDGHPNEFGYQKIEACVSKLSGI